MSHTCMSHELCHAYEWVASHVSMRHVTRMNALCHACEWATMTSNAVCCSVLQCVAVCCSVLQCGAVWSAVCCSALQLMHLMPPSVWQCIDHWSMSNMNDSRPSPGTWPIFYINESCPFKGTWHKMLYHSVTSLSTLRVVICGNICLVHVRFSKKNYDWMSHIPLWMSHAPLNIYIYVCIYIYIYEWVSSLSE